MNIRDVLNEDESGSIEKSVAKLILDTKRKKRLNSRPAKVRLGIVIKFIYIAFICLILKLMDIQNFNEIGDLVDALCVSGH